MCARHLYYSVYHVSIISVGRDARIPPQRDIIKLYHLPTLRPAPRDDASIVPYKSLFLFAAKFHLSSPSIHFLPRHHTKNAHSARYIGAVRALLTPNS